MPITQKDIAREVGVSQTVVSDVLQGRPRGRVSPQTRERILDAARRLSYRPNASARALRSRRSHQIAYLLTQGEAEQFDALGEQIIGGVARAVSRQGYRLVLEVARSRDRQAAALEEMLAAGVADACILRSFEDAPEAWKALRRAGCPVVVIGQVSDSEIPSVAHDVPGMVESTLRHLTGRGHRRIGLVTSARATRYHQLYRAAWGQAAPAARVDLNGWRIETDDRYAAEAAAVRWLASEPAPTAIVCHDQRVGMGAAAAARRAGRRIGEDFDLFLMTSGGVDWCCEPGSWCLRTDADRIGQRAAEELLRLLDGGAPRGPIRVLPEVIQL